MGNFIIGNNANIALCIILLLSINLVVFEYTVEIREPWFGELSGSVDHENGHHHQWLTGSTLIFSINWYREGPLNTKFAMIENPKSIEFPTLDSRRLYTSYFPLSILPIYIISLIVGHEPTPAIIMDYNLLNHFLIAFFLSMIIFFFLRQLKIDLLNSFLFSIIPILMELLLPAPLYWLQNVYFADQAVILPFVICIFLEVLRDSVNNANHLKIVNILQNVILFLGFLTDWLFVFIALTTYTKSIISKEILISKNITLFLKKSLYF